MDALQFLGECGFELVNVTTTVELYEGEQHPLSSIDMGVPTGRRRQSLQASKLTSLYVFKRLVGPTEPVELGSLTARTRPQLQHYFTEREKFEHEIKDRTDLTEVERARMFHEQYRPLGSDDSLPRGFAEELMRMQRQGLGFD
jgi:hypothetical protein